MGNKAHLISFAWGLLFGLGLAISGMIQPAKVLGFLDLTGAWDPTLVFVMGGALAVFSSFRPWVIKQRQSLFPAVGEVSSMKRIDARLLIGSAIFGIGWGFAGYCPGPAIVVLGTNSLAGIVVVIAMLVGIKAVDVLFKKHSISSPRR